MRCNRRSMLSKTLSQNIKVLLWITTIVALTQIGIGVIGKLFNDREVSFLSIVFISTKNAVKITFILAALYLVWEIATRALIMFRDE